MSLVKTDQLTNLNDDGQVEVLKGLKVTTGRKLSVLGPLGDASDQPGISGQVLTSSVSGVTWSNPQDLNSQYSISAEDSTNANRKIVRLSSDSSPVQRFFTPTNVTYDPATGISTFTVPDHGLQNGILIKIAPESIVFTCAMDGNKTEHALPGPGQSAYSNQLPISNVTTNTFDIDVGASGPNEQWTPTNATYNPSTGDVELTIGPHTLSVGEGVTIDDNSLSFTCDMDDNDSAKTYPRPGIDPFAGRSFKITAVSPTTITINAGASGPNRYFTPQPGTNYDAATGDLTVVVGQHGLGVGRSVVLEDNSFTFTCEMDNNATEKTYPRPGIDPFAGKSIPITSVGSSQHTVTDAVYDSASGNVKITVPNHGFNDRDYIKLDDLSLKFTCVLDGNTAEKDYPRAGYDYPSGRWLEITGVTTDTFNINIGPSSYEGAHEFVSAVTNGLSRQTGTFTINVGSAGSNVSFTPTDATYEPTTGVMEITIGSHSLSVGQGIVLDDNSFTFTCLTDPNAPKTYPRPGIDPFAGKSIEITAVTATTITVNVGTSSDTTAHTFVSATANAVKHLPESTHLFVSATLNAIKHEPQTEHTFVSATANAVKHLPQSAHTFIRSRSNSLSLILAGGSETDDVEFGGDSSILLTRTGDRINFNLAQNITTTSDVNFNNITAGGNLNVLGDFTVSTDLIAGGALKTNSTSLVFNNDQSVGSPTENANITVRRGTSPTTELRWNEGEDRWQFTNDGLTYYNILLPDETDFGATEQYGASGDATIYDVAAATVSREGANYTSLTFSIAEAYKNFQLNQRVKVFGASATPSTPPFIGDGSVGGAFTAERIAESAVYGTDGAPVAGFPHKYYTYWVAQYDILNGDIGIAAYTGEIVENIETTSMNGANYNKLTLSRTSGDYGLLIYRAEYATASQAINDTGGDLAELVGILGPQELGVNVSGIIWQDYGAFDVPSWTDRENDGRYKDTLIHFPLTIPKTTKRGWAEAGIKEIGVNYIILDTNLTFELSGVKVVHDDTNGIQIVIDNAFGSGQSYVFLPGGTFYVKSLQVPDDFTIKGLGDATVLKKQFFDTSFLNTATKEGVKGSMIHSKTYNFTSSDFTGPSRFGISDLVLDGNKENNIMFSGESNQSLMNFTDSELVSIQNMRVQNSVGPAIYAESSSLFSIENSTFLYGSETERYSTPVVQFTDSTNLKITDCLFFGFAGPLDATTSQVVGISASIIRNCGTGIRIYGAGKTNVLNNLILGPDDEWLPTPDIYDSDYNSVNYSINRGVSFTSPVFQYIERGEAKDLSNVTITGHLFPITKTGNTEVRGSNILRNGTDPMFQIQSTQTDLESGYILAGIPASITSTLTVPGENELRGHEITGSEFISSGDDINIVIQSGSYNASTNQYTIILTTFGEEFYEKIMVGDILKLQSHNSTPNLSPYGLEVVSKQTVGVETSITLQLPTGVSVSTNGGNTGYIQIENIFIIARGIVGVI